MIAEAYPALEALDRFRFLTSSQLATLLFLGRPDRAGRPRSLPSAIEAANERCLIRLKDRELIARLPVFRRSRKDGRELVVRLEVNVLTEAGLTELLWHRAEEGEPYTPRWEPGLERFARRLLDHELAINDVGVAVACACRQRGWRVLLWHDDALLRGRLARGEVGFGDFCPDAFFLVQIGAALFPFLVEVDRGTESVTGSAPNTWEKKIRRYQDYLETRYAADPFFAGLPSPRVLTLTTSATRLAHLRSATAELGGGERYWFALLSAIAPPASFLGSLWAVAGDGDGRALDDALLRDLRG